MFELSLAPARPSRYATRALPGAVAFHLLIAAWAIGASLVRVGQLPEPPESVVFAVFAPNLPELEPEALPEPTVQRPPQPPAEAAATPEVVDPRLAAEAEIPEAPAQAEAAVANTSSEASDIPALEGLGGDGPRGASGASAEVDALGEFVRIAGARRPEVLFRAEPRYLEPARRARVQGAVELDLSVDADGRVVNVQVVRGLPLGLTEEAERAVRQWRFRPAERNGRPVPVLFSVIVNFSLR